MKRQIVFLEGFITIPTFKLAQALKLTNKYETVLILFSNYNKGNIKYLEQAYDKVIYFNLGDKRSLKSPKDILKLYKMWNGSKKKLFVKKIDKLNPWIVQITGPELFPLIFARSFKNTPVIYFAHDIFKPFFKNKIFNKKFSKGVVMNQLIEYICFKKFDGILHKGEENELNLLNIKIKVPEMQYLSGCLDESILKPDFNKKIKKNNEFSLVFAGRPGVFWKGDDSFFKIVDIITSQEIHFHIYYPSNSSDIKTKFLKLAKDNKYFHLHKELSGKKLSIALSKYDFGIIPDFPDFSIIGENFMKTSFATKIMAYLEAGLPTIVSERIIFTSKFIEKNKIGASISYWDLKDLNEFLSKIQYKKLLKNVEKCQEKYLMSNVVKNIIPFYEKVFKNYYESP
jgi:hypothetical protein